MFRELYLIAGNVDFSWVTNQLSVYDQATKTLKIFCLACLWKKSIIHHLIVFKYWGKIFKTIGNSLWKWNKLLASSKAPSLKLRLLNVMLLISIIFQTHCTAFLALKLMRFWLCNVCHWKNLMEKTEKSHFVYYITICVCGVLNFNCILYKYSFSSWLFLKKWCNAENKKKGIFKRKHEFCFRPGHWSCLSPSSEMTCHLL